MMSTGAFHSTDSRTADGTQHDNTASSQNPLLCFVCDDYYSDPCLLNCFHTFCSRCLQNHAYDGKITCPLCGQHTPVKEGSSLPPDMLMRQLIEIANAENPPCSNCDKRDKPSMYFCSTCGQALCIHCRDNTHRAKMFSTHDVVHMSKCQKEGRRKCGVHGEQYIMFSNTQKNMLCVNCFRDTPTEARLHCVDIDTAYTQGTKKLEKAVAAVCDLQNSVKEGMLIFKNLLNELQHNMESEKHTINSFCQGMQEAIAKTHASMIMEVQRQFETRERQFRSQLISLSSVLPLLQLHLMLCSSFKSTASKYQFLDLAYPMMDRLSAVSQLSYPLRPVQSSQIRTNYRNEFSHALEPWVGKAVSSHHHKQQQTFGEGGLPMEGATSFENTPMQKPAASAAPTLGMSHGQTYFHAAPSRRQHFALKAKALEGEGPFSNHCRSFDAQLKELSHQLSGIKEKLGELHRDVTLLRRAHAAPIVGRYEQLMRECTLLEEQLERNQVELERLKNIFDTLWEEQLCRIHVEKDIFQSQMNDILALRSEVKHLSTISRQLEPYIKSFSTTEGPPSEVDSEKSAQSTSTGAKETSQQQLQSLIDHLSMVQMDSAVSYRTDVPHKGDCHMHPGQRITSPTVDNMIYMKVDNKDMPVREITDDRSGRGPLKVLVSSNLVYTAKDPHYQQQLQCHRDAPQLQAVPTPSVSYTEPGRDSKRSVLSQLIEKVRTKEDRKKSPIQEDSHLITSKDRSKSDGCQNLSDFSRQRDTKHQLSGNVGGSKMASRTGKTESTAGRCGPSRESSSKVTSLYHTISGKMHSSKDDDKVDVRNYCSDLLTQPSSSVIPTEHHKLPPPPPPVTSRRPHTHHETVSETLELSATVSCMEVREKLDSSKDKSHESSIRSIPSGRILQYMTTQKKKNFDMDREESGYQRISEATTSPTADGSSFVATKQIRAIVHKEPSTAASTPTSPHRPKEQSEKIVHIYPTSDSDDIVFYAKDEVERFRNKSKKQTTPSEAVSVKNRRSSIDMGDRKTLVVVIGSSSKGAKSRLMQKQRSWETFPPKKRITCHDDYFDNYNKFCKNPNTFKGGFDLKSHTDSKGITGIQSDSCTLKKADSFEGHEEAVRTLVAAVQETRSQQIQQQKKLSQMKSGSN